jgi:hypothetical protein
MNLEATRDKLEEARFFLRYLDETQNQPQSDTQTLFRYYLSAFVGAAYSVEQYLQTEVVRAMRQQARTQGKKLSEQQAGKPYKKLFAKWFTALPQEKQALGLSFKSNRRSEIHVERTKTMTTEKAMSTPLIPGFPYRSERSRAFGAHYVMQQQVAAWYPEMADRIKELGPLSGTGIWTYIQEHHLDIGGAFQSTVKACGDYVALFNGLISHFEKPAP